MSIVSHILYCFYSTQSKWLKKIGAAWINAKAKNLRKKFNICGDDVFF